MVKARRDLLALAGRLQAAVARIPRAQWDKRHRIAVRWALWASIMGEQDIVSRGWVVRALEYHSVPLSDWDAEHTVADWYDRATFFAWMGY